MSEAPKDIYVDWKKTGRPPGAAIYSVGTAYARRWDDYPRYTLNDGTLRETEDCVECKGSGEMSDEQDTPPWKCLFCNGTGRRVKP